MADDLVWGGEWSRVGGDDRRWDTALPAVGLNCWTQARLSWLAGQTFQRMRLRCCSRRDQLGAVGQAALGWEHLSSTE